MQGNQGNSTIPSNQINGNPQDNFGQNYNPNYNPNLATTNLEPVYAGNQIPYNPNLDPNINPSYNPNLVQNYDPNYDPSYSSNELSIPENYDSNQQETVEENPSVGQKIMNFLVINWIIVVVVVIIFAVVVVGGSIFMSNLNKSKTPIISNSGSYQNASVTIKGPETLAQGTPADWEVQVENFEAIPLINLKVELEFDRFFVFVKEYNPRPDNPEGSIYTIPRLDPKGTRGSSAIIRFQGFLNGNVDLETEMGGKISYTPQLSQTQFAQVETLGIKKIRTKITSPQIKITLDPTNPKVQNGGEAEFTVLINNTTDSEIRDLRLRMIYPGNKETFTYINSEYYRTPNSAPQGAPDNGDDTWFITRLPAGANQTLKIRGKVFGANNAKLSFGTEIGLKSKSNDYQTIWQGFKDVTIIANPLEITAKILNKDTIKTFTAGEQITVEVAYKNQSQKTLNNVEIFSFVQDIGGLLDLSTLSFEGGFRGDLSGTELVWKSPRIPSLENLLPNQGGKFSYSVKLKDSTKFLNTSIDQQKYILTPGVRARANNLEEISVVGNTYKARGNIEFIQLAPKFRGENPKTNKNIYTVTWNLRTLQNEVTDARIRTTSPIVGVWTGTITPQSLSSSLTYNEKNGEIVWNAGKIAAYTGLTKDAVSITFDIEVPKNNNDIALISPTLQALDVFTGEKYEVKNPDLKINQ
jgi:hypothetical protein